MRDRLMTAECLARVHTQTNDNDLLSNCPTCPSPHRMTRSTDVDLVRSGLRARCNDALRTGKIEALDGLNPMFERAPRGRSDTRSHVSSGHVGGR